VLIPIVYHYGGGTMKRQRFYEVPTEPFRPLSPMLAPPRGPDPARMSATGFGALFTPFLTLFRLRVLWWPFPPPGFPPALSARRTVDWMWFSIFLGWAVKSILLRMGGMPLYRRALPVMLGFILGEFSMGVLFGFLGVAIPDTAGYQLYP